MLMIRKYLLFWPILAAGVVFLALGLLLFIISERAMERAPKDAAWVNKYRKAGLPCRQELLPAGKLSLAAVIIVPVFAVVFQLAIQCNAFYFFKHSFGIVKPDLYSILLLGLSAVGAVAIYFSLNLLYGSSFAAFWGAMLFAASPLDSHGIVSLLACVFLLILLYLRTERTGFLPELLYLAAAFLLGMAISVCPPAVWLGPVLVMIHIWKLVWMIRQGKQTIIHTLLYLFIALLCWLVAAVLAALVRVFVLSGFSMELLRHLMNPIGIRRACSWLLYDARRFLAVIPRPGLMVNPLVDAPLFGLGIWGAVSAACMIGKRGLIRGKIALIAFAIIFIVWAITAKYLLPLGLAITTGALLKNADLGRRRLPAALIAGFGIAYDFAILAATWALPLCIDLICRLIRFH